MVSDQCAIIAYSCSFSLFAAADSIPNVSDYFSRLIQTGYEEQWRCFFAVYLYKIQISMNILKNFECYSRSRDRP